MGRGSIKPMVHMILKWKNLHGHMDLVQINNVRCTLQVELSLRYKVGVPYQTHNRGGFWVIFCTDPPSIGRGFVYPIMIKQQNS